MMNSKVFEFGFFLAAKENVNTLEEGAVKNGGATIYKDGTIYSNIEGGDLISVKDSNNRISVFVPSTIDVNVEIDNIEYVEKCVNIIKDRYGLDKLFIYNTKGSWYSDSMNEVVIEKITVLEMQLSTLTELDIRYFINIANILKEEMKQDGISLQINDSLAIV